MERTPVLLGLSAVESNAGADDPDKDEDHPDEHDEVSRVLAEWEARHGPVIHVRDKVVLDEVEKEPDGHHDQPEPGECRKRRRGRERRDRRLIGQKRDTSYLYS
jgi:hypothetical protein